MKIGKDEPVKFECTMPNGSIVWLTYDQWQQSPANWTGGIIGHREKAGEMLKVLREVDV